MFRRLPKEVYPLIGAVTLGVTYGVAYGAHVLFRHNDVHVNKGQPVGWQQDKPSPRFWSIFDPNRVK